MQDLQDLKSVLSKFASEKPIRANLFRLEAPEEKPEPTGAYVLMGEAEGRRFLEVRGLVGELPSNVRMEEGSISGSSYEKPDEWQNLEGTDAEVLRVFLLLDPRILAEQVYRADFIPTKGDGQTFVVGHVNLRSLKPGLPKAFLEWVKGDAFDREVALHFRGGRLVEAIQPDLYPRRADRIIERFDYDG